MKIGIVYFQENLNKERKHHEVNKLQIEAWCYFYKKSKTTLKPYLLSDQTKKPIGWEFDIIEVKDPNPPVRYDVLNKVGWIKAQGYETLGPCIIMDLDCCILQNLDHLKELECPIAMPIDPSRRIYADWPEVGEELNAGLILMNSPEILSRFKYWWTTKTHYLKITYFDEIIFSAICREFCGQILQESYNGTWPIGDDAALETLHSNPGTIILHFHGKRKNQLEKFYKKVSLNEPSRND
jgi:hypothetical protein